MQQQQRRRKARIPLEALPLRVTYQSPRGESRELSATLVDYNEGGIGIELETALPPGLAVQVAGAGEGGIENEAQVAWCTPGTEGRYRAGLRFISAAVEPPKVEVPEDYYDLLELNTKAAPETIHRVFRIQAQRYHPDNQETGNAELFKALLVAYRVLSDPEQRAAYDVARSGQEERRWKIFDQQSAGRGAEAEKRKRNGILALLYSKRMQLPDSPAVSPREMEEMLGVPREHLEFSIWYLRENGMIQRGDNGRVAITVKGVDAAEAAEAESPVTPINESRMLPPVTAGAA